MNKKGIFIVVEGIDGAGKSTQIKHMVDILSKKFPNKDIILTREPGGTNNPLGEKIRDLVLNNKMDDYTRMLLYAASRYEHQKLIQQWLEDDAIVVCDRYIYSSMAYQSNKKEDIEHIANVNDYFNIAIPDYIFHLDVSFETYSKRKAKRLNERQLDELEKKGDKFFKKNIEMYKEVYMYLEDLEYISNCLGENIKIPNIIYIDSNQSIDTTKKEIITNLNKIFN